MGSGVHTEFFEFRVWHLLRSRGRHQPWWHQTPPPPDPSRRVFCHKQSRRAAVWCHDAPPSCWTLSSEFGFVATLLRHCCHIHSKVCVGDGWRVQQYSLSGRRSCLVGANRLLVAICLGEKLLASVERVNLAYGSLYSRTTCLVETKAVFVSL